MCVVAFSPLLPAKPPSLPLTLMGNKNRLFFGEFGIFGDGLNDRSSDINDLDRMMAAKTDVMMSVSVSGIQ